MLCTAEVFNFLCLYTHSRVTSESKTFQTVVLLRSASVGVFYTVYFTLMYGRNISLIAYCTVKTLLFFSLFCLQIWILILPAEIIKCLRLRHTNTVCSVDILYTYILRQCRPYSGSNTVS